MAKSQIHEKIEAIAHDRGAMCLSADLIRATVLDSLLQAIKFGKSTAVLFPTGHDAVVGRYKDISLDPTVLRANLEEGADGLVVRISPKFTLTVELQTATAPAQSFCTIDLTVTDIALPVDGEGDLIYFRQSVAPITAKVVSSPTRGEAITSSGISPDDLLRIEGSIAFVAGARLVNSALGQVPPVNLKRLFPALSFGGTLDLHMVESSLLVIPERFALIGNPGCPKGDALAEVTISPQQPVRTEDGESWTLQTKLPQPSEPHFLTDRAVASTYLPKAVLDGHFSKTTPAVAYRDSGGGFIGYDVALTAAVRGIAVTIESAKGGLLLELDFATWGIATANVDVPCIGRIDLAQAKFQMPKANGTASIKALLRLAIDTGGRLIVVCELTDLELGEAQVDVQLFGKYLGMAGGKAAVTGFILDAVIGRVLAHNVPGLVFDTIKETLNQHFFVLADLGGFLKYLDQAPNMPTFSGDVQSALMGLTYRG